MLVQRSSRIFLTGFMGSGKSTLGPILANTLGYGFTDLDREIEMSSGSKVSDLFSLHGEDFFRAIERQLLQDVCRRPDIVVSLGGGTVAHEENLLTITTAGLLVYLKVDPEQILHRLRSKKDRPLIRRPDGTAMNETELRARIQELLQQRERFYRRADITVEISNQKVGFTVDQIVKQLRRVMT